MDWQVAYKLLASSCTVGTTLDAETQLVKLYMIGSWRCHILTALYVPYHTVGCISLDPSLKWDITHGDKEGQSVDDPQKKAIVCGWWSKGTECNFFIKGGQQWGVLCGRRYPGTTERQKGVKIRCPLPSAESGAIERQKGAKIRRPLPSVLLPHNMGRKLMLYVEKLVSRLQWDRCACESVVWWQQQLRQQQWCMVHVVKPLPGSCPVKWTLPNSTGKQDYLWSPAAWLEESVGSKQQLRQ